MIVGRTAYFSVNSLSKPSSLQALAIAILLIRFVLSPPLTLGKPSLVLPSVNSSPLCIKKILYGSTTSAFHGHFPEVPDVSHPHTQEQGVLMTKFWVLEIAEESQAQNRLTGMRS